MQKSVMSNYKSKLFIPNCTYCGAECTPLGVKKLQQYQEAKKHIFCSDACDEKHSYYEAVKAKWKPTTDKESLDFLDAQTRLYVDIVHTADKALTQKKLVLIFDDPRFSTLCSADFKSSIHTALQAYSQEVMERITI